MSDNKGHKEETVYNGDKPALNGSTRSIALIGLFVLALFYTLYFARAVFLPIVLAMLLNFLLTPFVRTFRRIGIPEGIGAVFVLVVLLGSIILASLQFAAPASEWIQRAPQSLKKIETKLRPVQKSIEQMSEAAGQVEDMTNPAEEKKTQKVKIEKPSILNTLLSGTGTFLAGAAIMLILLYFLLASGDMFLRKLIRAIPRLRDKKRAVEIVRDTESHVSRYLTTVTFINLGLGAANGFAMYLLDIPNPFLWGLATAVLNFIPYFGALVGMVMIGMVSTLVFDSLGAAILPPLVYFCLTGIEGYFITPMILGQRFTLNPVVIFISLIFWGWLWGIPGALLAVPLLATFKIFCDHIEPLYPIGEFLGR